MAVVAESDDDDVHFESSARAICHLDAFGPFTQGDKIARQDAFEEATAIVLAAHHLNIGDGSIVPQVEGLDKRCPIRFTVGFADTEYNARVALEHVVRLTQPDTRSISSPKLIHGSDSRSGQCHF